MVQHIAQQPLLRLVLFLHTQVEPNQLVKPLEHLLDTK